MARNRKIPLLIAIIQSELEIMVLSLDVPAGPLNLKPKVVDFCELCISELSDHTIEKAILVLISFAGVSHIDVGKLWVEGDVLCT